MVKCGSLMKSALVAAVLLAVIQFGSAWRHNSKRFQPPCCIKCTTANMTTDVIGNTYRQPPVTGPCVEAIILTTNRGPLCVNPHTKWVKEIIANMKKV